MCADLACMLLANLSGSMGSAGPALITLTVPIAPGANLEDGTLAVLARCGSCAAPAPRVSTPSRDVLALPLLVDAFVDGARPREAGVGRKGSLHFLSSMFANLSTVCTVFTVKDSSTAKVMHRLPLEGWHCSLQVQLMRSVKMEIWSTRWRRSLSLVNTRISFGAEAWLPPSSGYTALGNPRTGC